MASETMSIDKKDPVKEDSEESIGSSPEGEEGQANPTQETQQPKRKGGRKPVRFGLCALCFPFHVIPHWLACAVKLSLLEVPKSLGEPMNRIVG